MEIKEFGKLDTGATVHEYILKNADCEVAILDLGATVQRFVVYGTDIVGGYDSVEGYINDDSHQGGLIGRVANRIADASFTMDGKEYLLPKNDGESCLHGGCGFDRRMWKYEGTEKREGAESLTLSYLSADGEEGFPAELAVKVTYTLAGTYLTIKYIAQPSARTPISLTNHTYFNLDGLGGTVLGHTVRIMADVYTEVDGSLIPTGRRPAVKGTTYDFTSPRKIGERIDEAGGYDHNYHIDYAVKDGLHDDELPLIATVDNGKIKLFVFTDQPCVQFYTGNFLGGKPDFKGGVERIKHGALCLETQTEPNSIKRGIGFYDAGSTYTHTTVYGVERLK
ncbi:MAG: galactose mutarotase [Clostridia bacterium]|nr:galactose mutarotase [Clostridia bacterium]